MFKIDVDNIGIVAGRGIYPFLLADAAKKHGINNLTIAAVQGDADPSLANLANRLEWVYAGQLDKTIKLFKSENVEKVLFAGQIKPSRLFRGLRPDFRALKLLAKLKIRNADSIFSAVANEFVKEKITVLPATTFLDDYLVTEGVIGKVKPNKRQLEDINFGKNIAQEISRLNIGQTVIVKKGTILAVEGFEGTDKAILRGGGFGQTGIVVTKVAKQNQDMRFDVPCVGLRTVKALITARAGVLALHAHKTLLLEKESFIDAMNKARIAVVGIQVV